MTRHDDGHALIEALVLGVLLMTTLLILLVGLSRVHRAALAVGAAAREAALVAAGSADAHTAPRRAQLAAARALRNHGVAPSGGVVHVAAPAGYERGAIVVAEAAVSVPVVPMPGGEALRVTVRSQRSVRIDPFRSDE